MSQQELNLIKINPVDIRILDNDERKLFSFTQLVYMPELNLVYAFGVARNEAVSVVVSTSGLPEVSIATLTDPNILYNNFVGETRKAKLSESTFFDWATMMSFFQAAAAA